VIGPLRREFIQNFFLIFFKRKPFQDASTGDTLPIDLLNEWNSLIPPPTTKVTMKNLNYTATGTSYCEIE
jgi:hypothetical protein